MAKKKCKHVSLTHFMRRHCAPNTVRYIMARCNVSPYVGCLPPQLVNLVPYERRAAVTLDFAKCLSSFFNKDLIKMQNTTMEHTIDMPNVSALFHVPCNLSMRGIDASGCGPWIGGFGVVYKLSFPTIGAEYALKQFLFDMCGQEHGAKFEIPTAFAANHAEPRDNCTVYMASFTPKCSYMLSQWGGDVVDNVVRENKYKIFQTSVYESAGRNWRNGRRIDFGETCQSNYGRMTYPVRKLFRKALHAADCGYVAELKCMYMAARNNQERQDVERAIEMAHAFALAYDNHMACETINCYRQCR